MKKKLWKCTRELNTMVLAHSKYCPLVKAMPLLLIFSLLLVGCGGGGIQTEATYAETAAATYETAALEAGYDYGAEYEEYNYAMEAPPIMEDSTILTDSVGISAAVAAQRKLIRNVSMYVETDSFDELLKLLQSKVTELAGYVESSDISGFSMNYDNTRQNRYANLTARIPSDKLDQFIATVEWNGNVTNKSESTQDVTLLYSDLESRKKTLSVEQERIWDLLEKADTLEAVIVLEQHLSEIRYELESMESQLKLYDNQVEYSTIEISIQEVTPTTFTPTAPETVWQRIEKGFSKNIKKISDTMISLFIMLVAGSPIWIPFVAVVSAMVFFTKRQVKRRKKGHAKAEPVISSPSQETAPKDET